MSTPQTTIKICSGVRLDNSYRHSIYFDSLLDQKSYFESKVSWTFAGYSYCRKNWSIKLNATIAKARTWSYLFFDNPEDLKTYFYFITNVQYINEETVELFLELDVVQSYLFEMRLLPSFVERETPRSDEIGENTLDEGLDVGLYTIDNWDRISELLDLATVVMSSVDLNTFENTFKGTKVGEIYSGLSFYATTRSPSKIELVMNKLSEENKLDGIVSMWAFPACLIPGLEEHESEIGDDPAVNQVFYKFSGNAEGMEYTVPSGMSSPVPLRIDGYTPRNKKLFSYPFRYIQVTNMLGNVADYRFERFTGDDAPTFELYTSISPDGAVTIVPHNYNGLTLCFEEGISLRGFPTCAWTGDTYKIWLAQNQNQQNHQMLTSAGTSLAGAGMMLAGGFTGNPLLLGSGATMASHGMNSMFAQLAQKEDMKTYPPTTHGAQSASPYTANFILTFEIFTKTVTAERAKIIDDFFTMYGYKCQEVKTPSIHNRTLFTYTKTIGCTVAGEFCNEDKNKISSIFDNGVTFWTNGDLIGEYGEDNGFLD